MVPHTEIAERTIAARPGAASSTQAATNRTDGNRMNSRGADGVPKITIQPIPPAAVTMSAVLTTRLHDQSIQELRCESRNGNARGTTTKSPRASSSHQDAPRLSHSEDGRPPVKCKTTTPNAAPASGGTKDVN